MRRLKWTIQRKRGGSEGWHDCHQGRPEVLGYNELQEDALIQDFQTLVRNYPNNVYRIVQHVDFTPATKAAIKAR